MVKIMMGKTFFATLLLIVVVSCSEGDGDTFVTSTDIYDCDNINFTTQTTKALSSDILTMQSDTNGFVVYGVEINSSGWYDLLDGNRYIYDNTMQVWEWESSEAPSWSVPFTQMNFYAYYPQTASGFTLASSIPSSTLAEIVVEKSILNQTDYLAAYSGDIVEKPYFGVLSLDFDHITSKIDFSVLQDEGILTVIRQLGIENIIDRGSYDYINSTWTALSNTNIGSFDDYVGSDGPFAKYGVEDKIDPIRSDGHSFMLIPQSGGTEEGQTPLWDGSVTIGDSGDLEPEGAYLKIRYRTNSTTEDIVGYAYRMTSSNDSEWDESSDLYSAYKKSGGTYQGPLYIHAGFKLEAQQLDWVAGMEYDYNLQLNRSGGIHLSKYYYDVDGNNTKIRIDGAPNIGDLVFATDASIGVTVDGWGSSGAEIPL